MHSEEDDTSQASSKNLASLFEKTTSYGGNSSLMYKAPKQPKSLADSSPRISARPQVKAKETLNLILLKVLRSYKFVNNAYVDQGKVGVAISGNLNTRQYQLTLYKEKTSHLAQAQINSQFWFAVQPNNYAIFRDRNNILWSLLFDDSTSLIEFSTEIALARWACTESVDAAVSQDVFCAACSKDEKKVGCESKVEIALRVASISSAFKLDKEIETKKKCVINVSKTDSWSGCLVGSVIGNKKLIILPPNLQGKWKSSVQQNESIALEVEVLAVDPVSTLDCAAPKEMLSRPSPEKSSTVRVSEDTLTSTNSSSSSTHAQMSLISRMAKVGQALPFKGARVPDVYDSEDDVKIARPADGLKGDIEEPKSTSITEQSVAVVRQESSYAQSLTNQQVVATIAPNSVASVATSPPFDSQFSVFFSELRTNNSELRMGMNRVTDKLERVLDKMEVSSLDRVLDQLKSMETNIVSQFNIVLQKNVELIHSLKEDKCRNPSEFQHQNSVEHLMRENKELQEALTQCSLRAKELQEKVTYLNDLKSDLNRQLMKEQRSRDEIDQEHSSVILKLQAQLADQEKAIGLWSGALEKISRRVPELERKVERERNKMAVGEKPKTIRRLMTDVYKKLYTRFPDDASAQYSTAEVHDAIRDIIKATTLEYLNAQKNVHKRETASKKEMKSLPSVSSTDKSVEEKLKYTHVSRKDNTLSREQDSTSQCNAVEKEAAKSKELSSDETIIEVNSKQECEASDSMNGTLLDKTKRSDGSSSLDRENDSQKQLPTEDGQSSSFQNVDKNSDRASDQFSTEEVIAIKSDRSTKDSSEEDWSPKQPPPLFDDDDSESDDGWLNQY